MIRRTLYLKLLSVVLLCAALFVIAVAAAGVNERFSGNLPEQSGQISRNSVLQTASYSTGLVLKPAGAQAAEDTTKSNSKSGTEPEARLRRLDSLMRTAPSDSLPAIRAEYYRLRDSIEQSRRTPVGEVQTGGPTSADSLKRRRDTSEKTPPSTPPLTSDTTSLDGLDGFRTTELRSAGKAGRRKLNKQRKKLLATKKARARARATALTQAIHKAKARDAKMARNARPKPTSKPGLKPEPTLAKHNKAKRAATPENASPSVAGNTKSGIQPNIGQGPKPSSRRAADPSTRRMLEGIAAARAGKYQKAREQLASVQHKSFKRNTSRYYYARSLERTGRASEAASAYLKVARRGSTRAYIDYLRALAKSGQRKRARKLTMEYIHRRPRAPHSYRARYLLQTM